jgi:DNA-binding MarR family transcriptional regulator
VPKGKVLLVLVTYRPTEVGFRCPTITLLNSTSLSKKMMENFGVFDLIERMSALIRSEERKKCTSLGLQTVHLQALNYVSLCNKYSDTPAALANYLGMTRGTVSQTLSLLEKKGYLKKTSDTKDRRVVHLTLLPEGRAVFEQAKPAELFCQAAALVWLVQNLPLFYNNRQWLCLWLYQRTSHPQR